MEVRKIKNESIIKHLQKLTAEKETDYHKANSRKAQENKDKTEAFAEHLENSFTPHSNEDDNGELEDTVCEEIEIKKLQSNKPSINPKKGAR